MGTFRVMSKQHGDVSISWDPDKAEEVKVAEEAFEKYVGKQKWAAFEVSRRGVKTEAKITAFDPALGDVILVPPIAGG